MDTDAEVHDEQPTRVLRRLWKPIKEGAAAAEAHEAVRIRLHRCWSWMQRAEETGDDDERLILGWIALNSLYGRWDGERREPAPDGPAFDAFCRLVFEHDRDGRLAALLTGERALVKSIVGDEYLNKFFWREPGEGEARRAQNRARRLGGWYVDGRHAAVLDEVMRGVYLARCQLVHGAATHGGRLNREAVGRCAEFLEKLLKEVSLVIIDHAWLEEWGGLCYPPME